MKCVRSRRPPSGGVETQERDLAIVEKGLQLGANVAAISGEPSDKALDNVVERKIVVAGDDDDGPGQSLEKRARGGELRMAGPLRQIPCDDDKARPYLGYVGQQPLRDDLVVPSEMQV